MLIIYQSYNPSFTDTIDWINHIIRQDSERVFIKNLIKHLDSEKVESEWMFSKITFN